MKSAYGPTLDFHRLVAAELPPEDGQDAADAARGLLGTDDHAEVRRANGDVVWSQRAYAFLDDETPAPTVNPSLWRQARLNRNHGLFQVTPRIFQVRGYDISNLTFIEGDAGLIALDTLTAPETAAAALALYRRLRDPQARRRLHTIIYSHSHSHSDHFGGVAGLVTQAQVDAGEVRVIAPEGFLYHAVAENVVGGVAMVRRSQFQFGHTLPIGPDGQVDAGLGKNMPRARPSLIAPTQTIMEDYETHVIDGVEIEFQLTPETEAPAEMHFWFPGENALNLAENACHTLHNLCPLRGAKVRDSLAWARYLDRALLRYGDQAQVVLAQHHWPTWGTERVRAFLRAQRDLYRVLHDQIVRLMSHGLKPAEIAEEFPLPKALTQLWHTRGYYGSVSHNVKAVYQHYLSWYDAHPANLHNLPPRETAERTLRYMGGIDAVLHKAHENFERGDYRWVAEVMKHAVYAHPDHAGARNLAAETMEQLGFQAESATWRNAFLLAAREYREGAPKPMQMPASAAMTAAMTNGMLFDALAVRLNAPRSAGIGFTMAWHFSDSGEDWRLELSNGALHSLPTAAPDAEVALTLERRTLDQILLQRLTVPDALAGGRLRVTGDAHLLARFFGLLDRFSGSFAVVDAAARPEAS